MPDRAQGRTSPTLSVCPSTARCISLARLLGGSPFAPSSRASGAKRSQRTPSRSTKGDVSRRLGESSRYPSSRRPEWISSPPGASAGGRRTPSSGTSGSRSPARRAAPRRVPSARRDASPGRKSAPATAPRRRSRAHPTQPRRLVGSLPPSARPRSSMNVAATAIFPDSAPPAGPSSSCPSPRRSHRPPRLVRLPAAH